jgi:putative SOS response-associated peptidase YedK
MCGRFTLTDPDPRILRFRFDLTESAEIDEEPRFNIAPTDPVAAVRQRDEARELGRLRWGLLPGVWATEKGQRPLINARAESVATQAAFAESFRERRCLMPADGFYEWLKDDQRGKVPIWFSRPDGDLFAFAGIWAELKRRGDAEVIHSCALITCAPNDLMRPIHDRMPVVLEPEAEAAWLDPGRTPEELVELLAPAPDDALVLREVADLVNDVRKDGPELIEPREEQSALF